MRGRGACMAGGMAGGHAWWGACVVGTCVAGVCAWHGGMHGSGGMHGQGTCMVGACVVGGRKLCL